MSQALTCGKGQITSFLKKIMVENTVLDELFMISYVLLAMVSLLCPAGNDDIDKALLFPLMDICRIAGKN